MATGKTAWGLRGRRLRTAPAESGEDRAHDTGAVEPGIGIHLLRLGMVGEGVGQDQRTHLQAAFQQALMRQALTCGTFIMSSNAISADGQLVNIDGNANRVAALCFGPESVLVIAGMNKVMGDLDSAIARARQVAAPANAQRFDIKTPCAVTGSCGDCTSPDCICCQMVITRACRPAGRIKVILVGEDLGF